MSDRPDIAAALEPGETLLWRGFPQPGRRIPVRATVFAAIYAAATLILLLFAWYLEVWWGHVPQWHLMVFGLIGTAAFFAFLALRVSLLDRRRARARDRRTAYGITDRRALALAGPYRSEVRLVPGVTVKRFADSVTVEGETARLRFERLDDAGAARNILASQIEGIA
jgi:hypothetical protein